MRFECKVLNQCAVLGLYDFISVVAATDNEIAAHLSIDLGSRGTVNIEPLPAFAIPQLTQVTKGPRQTGNT